MNQHQAKEALTKHYGSAIHNLSPQQLKEMTNLIASSEWFSTPDKFDEELYHYQQHLMIDKDKYVYLIQEGIEDILDDRYDFYYLDDYGDKTLTYKVGLLQVRKGEEVITYKTSIKFNKYTGEEIIK